MTEYPWTTEDLAAELGVARVTIQRRARGLHLGINFRGRAGYRFSEADRRKLLESMMPVAPVAKRQRKRGRAA